MVEIVNVITLLPAQNWIYVTLERYTPNIYPEKFDLSYNYFGFSDNIYN
jgi:hypothetical protein